MSVVDDDGVAELIALAKREDLGSGDLSVGLLANPHEPATFRLVAKEEGVFAGREVAVDVLRAYDKAISIVWTEAGCDGRLIERNPTELATLCGPVGSILSAERTLLNFLQRLCGIATLTRRFVDAVAGTGVTIYDTRKTTPGWRSLEKYAVRCGGGRNHRRGLHDAVMLKDNHLAGVDTDSGQQGLGLAETVFEMLNRLGEAGDQVSFVAVEVRSVAQVEELLNVERKRRNTCGERSSETSRENVETLKRRNVETPAESKAPKRSGFDVLLLDNFSVSDIQRAVEIRNAHGLAGKVALEASGGVRLENVRRVAETGVDRISVGAITHSATAIDLSLERTCSERKLCGGRHA